MALSVRFPMIQGPQGFLSYTDDQISEAVNQNLKMLLLTRQGEYTFDINFGAGLGEFLFELADSTTEDRITSRITTQITRYMPYVVLRKIVYDYTGVDSNAFGVRLEYTINEELKVQYLRLHIGI